MIKRTQEVVLKAIKAARKRLPKRPRVVDIRHEFGQDWFGEDAVTFWLILDDRDRPSDQPGHESWSRIQAARSSVKQAIEDALAAEELNLMVYSSVRLKSEQDEMDRELVS